MFCVSSNCFVSRSFRCQPIAHGYWTRKKPQCWPWKIWFRKLNVLENKELKLCGRDLRGCDDSVRITCPEDLTSPSPLFMTTTSSSTSVWVKGDPKKVPGSTVLEWHSQLTSYVFPLKKEGNSWALSLPTFCLSEFSCHCHRNRKSSTVFETIDYYIPLSKNKLSVKLKGSNLLIYPVGGSRNIFYQERAE